MNTRFKFFLINYLGQRRVVRDSGFALPMAIMVGASIIVVGLAVVIQAQGNKSKVSSQVTTSQANAIAEAGATQYTNFLNQNRALLTYPDCTVDRNSDGNCPDTGAAKSWSLISNIVPSPLPQGGNTCTNATVGGSTSATTTAISTNWANGSNSTGWKAAGDGEYKIVGYKYTPSDATKPNTAPGVAVLAVQGKAGNSGNQGTAQVHLTMQVNTIAGGLPPIPQINTPGLWARSFNTAATVHAHVLDSSGCTSGNTAFPSGKVGKLPVLPIGPLPNGNKTPPLTSTMGVVTKDANGTPFPPLPYYPTNAEFTTLVANNKVNQLTSCPTSKTAYPTHNDKDADGNTYNSTTPPTTAKVYKYRITGNCTLPANVTFGTASGQDRIIMYIDANLDIGNNAMLGTNGTNRAKVQWLLKTDNLDLGGNSQVGSASPTASTATNWSFFVYEGTTVSMRGTPDYYAFIFAPKAEADLRGNPKIAGALWVNSYKTNGAPPKVFQAVFKNDFNTLFSDLYTDTGTDVSALSTPNLLGNVLSYSKQEVGSPIAVAAAIPAPAPVVVDNNPTPNLGNVDNTCTVPSLTGINLTDNLSLDLVRAALATANLSEGTATANTSNVSNGVKTQSPAANTVVNCGSTVNYTYKITQASNCTVPNLVNVGNGKIGAATTEWQGAGFTGVIINSIAASNGKIASQSWTQNTSRSCSSSITVY